MFALAPRLVLLTTIGLLSAMPSSLTSCWGDIPTTPTTPTPIDEDDDGFSVDDCDDTNPSAYPGAPELCSPEPFADEDCDGTADEDCTSQAVTCKVRVLQNGGLYYQGEAPCPVTNTGLDGRVLSDFGNLDLVVDDVTQVMEEVYTCDTLAPFFHITGATADSEHIPPEWQFYRWDDCNLASSDMSADLAITWTIEERVPNVEQRLSILLLRIVGGNQPPETLEIAYDFSLWWWQKP